MIFDDSYTVFNDFALAKEGAQDGFGSFGRVSRAAKYAKTPRLASVKGRQLRQSRTESPFLKANLRVVKRWF